MSKYSDIWAMIGTLEGGGMEREELKCLLCEGVSDGRTDNLQELTAGELSQLRAKLRRETGSRPQSGDKSRKRRRSAVLKLLTDYGIDTQDWQAINAFVSEKRIAGKEFALLDNDELEALRRKLWAMLRKQKQVEQKRQKAERSAPRTAPRKGVRKGLTLYVMNKGVNNNTLYN